MCNNINEKLMNSIIEYLETKPNIYKNQKYDLEYLLPIILYVLKNNISWRRVSDLKMTGSVH